VLIHVQLDAAERRVRLSEFEDLVRSGRIGPETPVREDGSEIWTVARMLAAFRDVHEAPESALRRAWVNAGMPWFTVILVGLLVRVHLWLLGPRFVELKETLVRSTPAVIEQGQLWRLFTYGFLHADLGHIAFNLLLIAYVGASLERVLGAFCVATLFVVSVFWGGLASSFWDPTVTAIGASAADFGYLGAGAVFGLRWLEVLPERARPRFGAVLLFYVAYSLYGGLTADGDVDNAAHIGGLVAGAVLTFFLRPNVAGDGAARRWRSQNRVVHLIAWGTILAACAALWLAPPRMEPAVEDGLVASRPELWKIGFGAGGDPGWKSEVTSATLVVDTTRAEGGTLDTAIASFTEDFTRHDPAAAFERVPSRRDEIDGVALTGRYTYNGQLRLVNAEIYVRGSYLHRVVLDVPEGLRGHETLRASVFSSIALPVPEDVATARAAPASWHANVERAEAELSIGDRAAARALLEAARAEAPQEPAPMLALLELPGEDVPARVEQALAAFPQDRKVRVACIRALYAAGHVEDARALLARSLTEAPGDRRYEKVAREIAGP
jgi:membrane associated rhomboid family serine protease